MFCFEKAEKKLQTPIKGSESLEHHVGCESFNSVNEKIMFRRFLLVFSIISLIERCNCEVNITKKCDEGWQGNDCEFCAGKIR